MAKTAFTADYVIGIDQSSIENALMWVLLFGLGVFLLARAAINNKGM